MTNEPVPFTNFVSETASEHVCRLVPVTSPETQIGELRRSLEQVHFESATHIGICDRDKFVGVLRVEDLFGALAVIDNGGRFVGFIPPDRLLAVLLHEHDEDMARVGGFLRDSSMARTASEEPVARRFWHRVPWLLLGLLGAVLAADIVGLFEKQLQANVMLAFFIPGIVYLADAVGTQTEALVIRGLSVGVAIGHVVRREIFTGLFVGFTLAAVFFPIGLWRWGDVGLAMVVALSIFAACATASFVALSLPWVLNRMGIDPAFGSGPLATVIQDLLSVIIYLVIATAIPR